MNYSALTTTTRVTALRETSTGGRLPLVQSHVARAYLGQGGEPATTEQVRRRVHWITSQVRGPRVLDIDTSGGLVPILLGREGFHVVGLSLDSGASEWAKELLEQEPQVVRDRVQFRSASLLQEDRDLQFDTLILSDVLEQVVNAGHFIETAVQHLRPGGRLIATAPFGLHPDPSHKHSFFISDIQRLFSGQGRLEQLSVVEGYIRLILTRGEAATETETLPGLAPGDALALTEEATLASQSLLWRQLETAAQQVERLRDEVAAAEQRASQAEEEKQAKQAALEAATADLSVLQERLQATDTRLQERQRELEELRRSLDARAQEAGEARTQAAGLRARHDLLQQELRQREADLVRAKEQQEAAQEKLAERQARIAVLEQSLAQAASHFSSRGGINETGAAWLTEAARDEAEVAATQQQLEDAERLLAERTAQLEEQTASVAEWVDECARLEEEKEKAERRAADAEGSSRASTQELLQAQQALVEAEARHEAALAQLDERQLLIEEQAEELKELRGRIENFAKQLELNAHALEQARQREQKASQELSVRNARIAELEQRVAQQIESLSTQESDFSRLRGSQEALGKEVRALRQQLATQEKAYAALEQQLIQESAQVSARSHELEKSQAARTALAAEADKLRKRLDAANYEKQAAEQELAALKAVAANQLTVLDGERLLWVEPLLELFRRVEVQAHRPVEPRQRSFLGSRSRIKQPDTAKLEPRKLANLSTEIAKERYRDDPFAMLLLASLADALDPQPARRKWLGFRMVHAGLLDGAEQVLTPLQGKMPFSPSEQKVWEELTQRPKPPVWDETRSGPSAATSANHDGQAKAAADVPNPVLDAVPGAERPVLQQDPRANALDEAEELVQLANRILENSTIQEVVPVEGRLALITSQAPGAGQNGYGARSQKLARMFQREGWDVFCMPRPDSDAAEDVQDPSSAAVDGIRLINGVWPEVATPTDLGGHLFVSVEIYTNHFKEHRPKVVIAAGDFTSALPAIIAAKRLSLPVIKEQLHYAEAFIDHETKECFSKLDFSQKFAVEQACLSLADASYYLHPDDSTGWEALLEIVCDACHQPVAREPLAVLHPKASYTLRHTPAEAGLYYLELDLEDRASGNPKGIVNSFRFFDAHGQRLEDKVPGFFSSKAYPHYQYVDTSPTNTRYRVAVFQLPDGVSRLEVDVVAFLTQDTMTLRRARIGKVTLEDAARWLTLKVPGVHWIKAVESYVHGEGAASLRLALLNYKSSLSRHPNDLAQLKGAVQEMLELDPVWVPRLARNGKSIQLPRSDKLAVAHLHKTAYPYENTGGAIRCFNTVLSQQRIGMDPYIITPIGYPRSAGVEGAPNREVIAGIEHFRIGANTDGLWGLSPAERTSYSAFHIAKLIKERGANLIHAASGVRGYELALQALALKKLTGLPLLYEVRSFHEHTWTHVRSDVMDLEKTRLRVIKEDFCMAEADLVVTICSSMKSVLIERGVSADKIEVIPNAIDESKYVGREYKPIAVPELEGADFVVGYISNMSRREGHQYLIRAIHQLRLRTGLDVRGLLVGSGPERDNLIRLTTELGLERVIAFPGEVDHKETNAYYKAIDLFVVPRVPDYAADWVTPLKPYEAMALERPVIVSDLPALREIVGDNNERGLVAKPADVDSLVEQLQHYIEDPELRQAKVDAARDWVFQERTWSANAKRYDAIYRRLLAGNGIGNQEALHA